MKNDYWWTGGDAGDPAANVVQDGPIRARPLGDVRAANIVLVLQQRVAATRHRVLLATSHQEVTSVSAIALISSTDQQLVAHGDALDGPTALPSSPTHTGTWPSGTPAAAAALEPHDVSGLGPHHRDGSVVAQEGAAGEPCPPDASRTRATAMTEP